MSTSFLKAEILSWGEFSQEWDTRSVFKIIKKTVLVVV